MQTPRVLRGRAASRTLETLKDAHQRFVAAGSDITKAKEFKNAIDECFFEIPINNVGAPQKC